MPEISHGTGNIPRTFSRRGPNIIKRSLGKQRFQPPRKQPLGELCILLFDEEQDDRQGALGEEVGGKASPERGHALRPCDGGERVKSAAVSRLLAGFLLLYIYRAIRDTGGLYTRTDDVERCQNEQTQFSQSSWLEFL